MRLISGEYLRKQLDIRGMTSRSLAEKVQVNESFISLLISGQRGCTADTAALIVHVLNECPGPELSMQSLFVTRVGVPAAVASIEQASTSSLPKTGTDG